MSGHQSESADGERSDITIGELYRRLSSLDTNRSELQRHPGIRRLFTAALRLPSIEARDLNWFLFDFVRQKLSARTERSVEWIDGLRLSEAAQVFEQNRGNFSTWEGGLPEACTKCGRRLADEDRAWWVRPKPDVKL